MNCSEKASVLHLLKTARGKTDGVIKMFEEDRYCIDISKQILSIQELLEKTNIKILGIYFKTYVKTTLIVNENTGNDEIDEILKLMEKYIK